jgi:hypothetical protein
MSDLSTARGVADELVRRFAVGEVGDSSVQLVNRGDGAVWAVVGVGERDGWVCWTLHCDGPIPSVSSMTWNGLLFLLSSADLQLARIADDAGIPTAEWLDETR